MQYHLRGMTQLKSENDMSLISYNATPNEKDVSLLEPGNHEVAGLKSIIVALSIKLKAKEVTDEQNEALRQRLAESEAS